MYIYTRVVTPVYIERRIVLSESVPQAQAPSPPRNVGNLQNDDCIIICWEGVLVGFFGICEFTPRVPPRESRTLPDTWGARILGHGESNARVGSTCKWND